MWMSAAGCIRRWSKARLTPPDRTVRREGLYDASPKSRCTGIMRGEAALPYKAIVSLLAGNISDFLPEPCTFSRSIPRKSAVFPECWRTCERFASREFPKREQGVFWRLAGSSQSASRDWCDPWFVDLVLVRRRTWAARGVTGSLMLHTVINGQTVLVEPKTRHIVQIIM